jgi:hypothetical protein
MAQARVAAGLCRSPIGFLPAYFARNDDALFPNRRAALANTKPVKLRQLIFVFMRMRGTAELGHRAFSRYR